MGFSLGFVVINGLLAVFAMATLPMLLALYDPLDYMDHDKGVALPMNYPATYGQQAYSYGLYGETLRSGAHPAQYARR